MTVKQVKGKQIALGGLRHVFMAEGTGCWYIEFRSKEGSLTRMMLSDEAMKAINALSGATEVPAGMTIVKASKPRELESRWQLLPEMEA